MQDGGDDNFDEQAAGGDSDDGENDSDRVGGGQDGDDSEIFEQQGEDDRENMLRRGRLANLQAERAREKAEKNQRGGSKNPGLRARLGVTVQRSEVQVVMLLIICLDVISALVQMFMEAGVLPTSGNWGKLAKVLEYNAAVTNMVYLMEMVVVLISFGLRILSHPGYSVDLIIVGTQVYFTALQEIVAIRLLGGLRLWRLVRLVDRMLEDERDAHAETLETLESERDRVDDLLAQLRVSDRALKRETKRLGRAQEMLRTYKDEIGWLVDALQIAAESAAAGQTGLSTPEASSIAVPLGGAGAGAPAGGSRSRKIKIDAAGRVVS